MLMGRTDSAQSFSSDFAEFPAKPLRAYTFINIFAGRTNPYFVLSARMKPKVQSASCRPRHGAAIIAATAILAEPMLLFQYAYTRRFLREEMEWHDATGLTVKAIATGRTKEGASQT